MEYARYLDIKQEHAVKDLNKRGLSSKERAREKLELSRVRILASAYYKKLEIPFCTIKTIKINLIINGIGKNATKIKTTPVRKSIQLAKSLRKLINDLAKRTIPKTMNNFEGSSVKRLRASIPPDNKSIAPKILTSMFFKPRYYLKIYQP